MKRIFFASLGAVMVGTAPTLAADMPLKAPPQRTPAAVIASWTGFYGGIHAGYGWGDARVHVDPNSNEFDGSVIGNGLSMRLNGAVVGGQVGYNLQQGNWLFGVEADGSWAGIDGNFRSREPAPSTFYFNVDAKVKWLATVRGRMGVVSGSWLFYGTGGVAFGGTELSGETNYAGYPYGIGDSQSKTRVGWVAGAGIEMMLSDRVSAKLEYLHYGLGRENFFFRFDPPSNVNYTYFGKSDFNLNVVRVGLQWRPW